MEEKELSLADLKEAASYVESVAEFRRTPLLADAQNLFGADKKLGCSLYLKLESTQFTGSFKYRGVLNQIRKATQSLQPGQKVVTFSGGNYGRAFATVTQKLGLQTVVVMPSTVPKERVALIESLGATVDLQETCNLNKRVAEHVASGMRLFHPYDDLDLVQAYAGVGFEILEQLGTEPDIILVPCGGGGLVSGIAAAVRLSGCTKAKIFAVEPEGANTMKLSMLNGSPHTLNDARSVATGLCPPNTGAINLRVCTKYLDGVTLVSDSEIIAATTALIKAGLIVEPSGAAAIAGLLSDSFQELVQLEGKKVVVIISGRNIAPAEVSVHLNK